MTDALFTFTDLLRRAFPDWRADGRWKVVRHIDNRPFVPNLLDLFHMDREALEFYQADQSKDVFAKCEGIFSFLGLPGRRALFIGAYFVRDGRLQGDLDPRDAPPALRSFYEYYQAELPDQPRYVYDLSRDARFRSLEMRAVVAWGPGTLAWHQWDLDKPVVELRDANALAPCPAYRDVDVTLAKLRFLAENEDANPSWVERLSAVGGIYLLTDRAHARLYVGQAGGEGGFWGRWRQYATNQSGNIAIDAAVNVGDLQPLTTSLSILEVVPRAAGAKPILDELESRWKRRLCSTAAGYNRN
jgi:hypothetical protein